MDPMRCNIRLVRTFSEKVALLCIWHLRERFFAAHDLVVGQSNLSLLHLYQRPPSPVMGGGRQLQ